MVHHFVHRHASPRKGFYRNIKMEGGRGRRNNSISVLAWTTTGGASFRPPPAPKKSHSVRQKSSHLTWRDQRPLDRNISLHILAPEFDSTPWCTDAHVESRAAFTSIPDIPSWDNTTYSQPAYEGQRVTQHIRPSPPV